ncbi:YdbC family protein [Sporolactobacillus sp. THM19-2]|jgi:hypothetical protein|uniref:YdbC family protein n=1 Tax=Sporolactobacillus sp. THM19-2 TaxID=2511171 RepID=UPI0010218923|nr:PC4/YdbC family ssDNA-binding protein [Sporolactobacillus sp. THM19-2]RYL91511.1 hypothetical protein EWH91_09100 [Sporolactobacillus sp. THM19-2]
MSESEQRITCHIVEHFGVLSKEPSGWTREFNLVSWNNREAKYDIRSWSADKKKMRRGITLTGVECDALRTLLNVRFPRPRIPASSEPGTPHP